MSSRSPITASRRPASPRDLRRGSLLLRLLAAIGGSYACTASLASLSSVLAVMLFDLARSEAVYLTAMLSLLVYPALLLWSVSEPRLWRVWAILLSGTFGSMLLQDLLTMTQLGD